MELTIAQAVTTEDWDNILGSAIALKNIYGEELRDLLKANTKVELFDKLDGYGEMDEMIRFTYEYNNEEYTATYNISTGGQW